ncbi:MAG: benzoyl-CoA oxygenase, partial [Rubrivivax sp.]
MPAAEPAAPSLPAAADGQTAFHSAQYGAAVPPWSAAHADRDLSGPTAAPKSSRATCTGKVRAYSVADQLTWDEL